MFFEWLKRYVPRGLYGRAALILVLPVVTMQLVVSVVFIQRHFEGVTEQMTRSVSRDVNLVLSEISDGEELAVAEALEMEVLVLPISEVPAQDSIRWYDLSGRVVARTLRELAPGMLVISLPDDYAVELYLRSDGPQEALLMTFDRQRVSASNPHQLLVNMAFFGVLMTVISFIYLRNQLRPVTRLAKAAEAFGRGRHIEYRPAGAVEVRAAGHAFLDMRARLERQIEQRTLLLSGVSHDLRTPLTRMRLAVSLLEDGEREELERDIEDMQSMLDEFLSFARGTSEEAETRVDPLALVREIVHDAGRAGQDVRLVLARGEGEMALRPLAIRRAVENLIGNAVRYGTRAEVSVELTPRSLRIRVEDDGPGIPADRREEAMKPFTRLDTARNQNRGSGVGLGLSIAGDTARMHGGILRLGDSEALGGLCADLVIAR
ncbi:two-component system, OmpR family, osmolarity sensor histidine kinase EnvZ [Pseudooceanicola antarcticus]|uniref:histidine kinase n=1 Tax=Pseudooceanicola antarcticus TaxID=1247613 RepID=A0A285IZ19_9RHOB|nr:ATP-binding protein [Pseudooceanicola antarcticus]PJE25693.1 two-component sensor histidine kinase [Pseudooceanicola antarcticus]SNY53234.1 two-component system, OmpR family, osmolarity sensor histidine kinase EnvZ [Pseudooceanicola antarcticus]